MFKILDKGLNGVSLTMTAEFELSIRSQSYSVRKIC